MDTSYANAIAESLEDLLELDSRGISLINRLLFWATLLPFLTMIACQANAVSWTENWDTGYIGGDLIHSPWTQQTNDGITGGAGRDLTITAAGGYSGANNVYSAVWDLGLVSRPTGALATDTNVVATATITRVGQEQTYFVLSPQGNHNGTKWMNVPGSLIMHTNGYSGSVDLISVSSAGVPTTVTVSGYPPESAWTLWRFVLPKASGAQTATLERNIGSGWSMVASIAVDSSFKADYIGFGSYWTSAVDDINNAAARVPTEGVSPLSARLGDTFGKCANHY